MTTSQQHVLSQQHRRPPRTRRSSPAALGAALLVAVSALAGCGALGEQTASPAAPVPVEPTSPGATSEPTAAAFEDVLKQVRSGVVRFEVTGCDSDSASMGSGFLVAPDLVVTVAHVVEDGTIIRVVEGTRSTAARVIGVDAPADVALLETVAPLEGHLFTFAQEEPEVTDRLAVLGFPDGAPLTVTQGTVNGLDRKSVIGGLARHSLIEHDAAATGGSSGGAVVNVQGEIIGLHDASPKDEKWEGGNLAVSGRVADERVSMWREAPEEVPTAECEDISGPEGAEVPEDEIDAATARHVASTLNVYFEAINGGDFTTAFAQRVPSDTDFETFRDAVRSSQDYDFEFLDLRREGEEVVAGLTFVSQQEAGAGPADRPDETCTRWFLDYRFQQVNGLWLIAVSEARGDWPRSIPCEQSGTDADPRYRPTDEPTDDPTDDPSEEPTDEPTDEPTG